MAKPAKMPLDSEAWRAGFAAGLGNDKLCPYPHPSDKALAWSSGWIEGEAKRLSRDEGEAADAEG